MIKTPLSTVLGGAFWTPKATILGGTSKTFDQIIQSLFANNEQGFFCDPNDLSTMFQDAAGTVPVTDAGQPVGLILDKSGRSNHAFQDNSASRPILRKNAVTGANYLEFDGADDSLRTNSIDFTASDKMSLFVGLNKTSTLNTVGIIFELSENATINSGSFFLASPNNNINSLYGFRSRGLTTGMTLDVSYANTVVISAFSDLSANKNSLRLNSSENVQNINTGGGSFGNYPLYIGRRSSAILPFRGHIYGLIGVGKLVSNNETAAIEKELAKRVGVTLNV